VFVGTEQQFSSFPQLVKTCGKLKGKKGNIPGTSFSSCQDTKMEHYSSSLFELHTPFFMFSTSDFMLPTCFFISFPLFPQILLILNGPLSSEILFPGFDKHRRSL